MAYLHVHYERVLRSAVFSVAKLQCSDRESVFVCRFIATLGLLNKWENVIMAPLQRCYITIHISRSEVTLGFYITASEFDNMRSLLGIAGANV